MNYTKWKLLADEGYSSDVISFLSFLKNGEEIDMEHPKSKALIALMERKELIVEGKLSVKGEELLENSSQLGEISIKVKKSDKFEEWWKTYPATDAFSLNGKDFGGSQSKRVKKDICKKTFDKIINAGTPAEDIIKATAYHIEQAKKLSLKKGTSQLSYIANSERYLREEMFAPYIELSKEIKPEEKLANPNELWN